jgi:hypothetical protein
LAFQSLYFERIWWRLFQKCIVRTKFDIYVVILLIQFHVVHCQNNWNLHEWREIKLCYCTFQSYHYTSTYIGFGLVMFSVGIIALLLPETYDRPLPDILHSRHRIIASQGTTRIANCWSKLWNQLEYIQYHHKIKFNWIVELDWIIMWKDRERNCKKYCTYIDILDWVLGHPLPVQANQISNPPYGCDVNERLVVGQRRVKTTCTSI